MQERRAPPARARLRRRLLPGPRPAVGAAARRPRATACWCAATACPATRPGWSPSTSTRPASTSSTRSPRAARATSGSATTSELGATASQNSQDGNDSNVYAADLTLRKTHASPGSSSRPAAATASSRMRCAPTTAASLRRPLCGGPGQRGRLRLPRRPLGRARRSGFTGFRGQVTLYGQRLEAGYSSSGLSAEGHGSVRRRRCGSRSLTAVDLTAKGDRVVEDRGLDLDDRRARPRLPAHRELARSGRRSPRRPRGRLALVVETQDEGDRTDAVVQIGYDYAAAAGSTYGFGQGTRAPRATATRTIGGGVGGAVPRQRPASHSTARPPTASWARRPARHELSRRPSRRKLYMNYALENERGYDGLAADAAA